MLDQPRSNAPVGRAKSLARVLGGLAIAYW
jgi:hypothetical protein